MDIQMKDTPLNWDPKKKAERDAERDLEITLKRIGDMYSDWQNRLVKQARTRKQVIAALYELVDMLKAGQAEYDAAGFPAKTTIDFITNQKIIPLEAIQICATNTAIQHVPASLLLRTDVEVKQLRADFRTRAEFDAIPWVKHFAEQPGFQGFFSKVSFEKFDIKLWIVAKYETDSALVCEVFNDVAFESFEPLEPAA